MHQIEDRIKSRKGSDFDVPEISFEEMDKYSKLIE
jgi:hypothetical protein